MYDNYNYPMGADNEDAPWNQSEPPEREFDVTISQTLSRSVAIATSDYIPEVDEEDGRTYPNTEYTDWKRAYQDASYTPLALIAKFKELMEIALKNDRVPKNLQHAYKNLIMECEGWEEDDYEVIEE